MIRTDLPTLSYHSKCSNFRVFLTVYDKVYMLQLIVRCYASAAYAVMRCVSVCDVCVCHVRGSCQNE